MLNSHAGGMRKPRRRAEVPPESVVSARHEASLRRLPRQWQTAAQRTPSANPAGPVRAEEAEGKPTTNGTRSDSRDGPTVRGVRDCASLPCKCGALFAAPINVVMTAASTSQGNRLRNPGTLNAKIATTNNVGIGNVMLRIRPATPPERGSITMHGDGPFRRRSRALRRS